MSCIIEFSNRGSKASKIPPIYERPTTSNISVEEGGVFNVSKPCNRQPLPLSVSRGVRSRPLGEGIVASTKVDTIPLLSPTMESELLKEPWVFPRTKANPTKEEDTAAFSAWEENFQDLSSWCMDTFQAQCDFHIGESTTFKLSGTKYEGNGVSTVEEDGILKDLRDRTDDEKWNLKMDTVKATTGESSDTRHLLLSPTELVKYEKGYGNEENYASSSWLMSPESTASTSTSSSKQHNTTDISAPIQPEYRVSNDYACPASFDSTAGQHETWDELPTIEAIGSDTFDLLSYLCDDEMRSPEGSVSTDSTAVLKQRSLTASSPIFTANSAKVKTEVKTEEITEPPKRRRMETRATSTMTSSPVETPTTSSRRSERTRSSLANNKGKERITVRTKKEKNDRKRYYESDSDEEEEDDDEDDDEDITLMQYRESREKNNEASRKSRMNKKAKESEMAVRAVQLEKDNKILKMKVEELEKLVTSMRNALLQSALKKEF
ncbi:PREDICTED: protein giant-like [Dinoponera quadriceps]|uniref:Protein giant-like n=1 Tax=Dinoponera quadriceps TaxID=609295 RepID=A0A6P3WTL6_DINQU|nr:PREDICTED: protein giant-like [Dinoponera quadriceps]